VQAFDDFEKALAWLSEQSPANAGAAEEELPVPITRRERHTNVATDFTARAGRRSMRSKRRKRT
jgi:hypothetical protein